MNPDTQIPPAETPATAPEPAACSSELASPSAYRGNGKIARLPKSIRDQINHWLLDGVSYPDIIERLAEHGKDLKPDNLSQWKKRGHQDWLLMQHWLDQTRARQEPASDLSTDFDATQLNHAALQLGSLHMFEALRDLAPIPPPPLLAPRQTDNDSPSPLLRGEGRAEGSLADQPPTPSAPPLPGQDNVYDRSPRSVLDLKLGGDSAAFVRLINALARASRETMLVQKYRDACAKARAALLGLKDPNRKLNERETRAIVRKVDEILGFCSPEDDEPEKTQPCESRLPGSNGTGRCDIPQPESSPSPEKEAASSSAADGGSPFEAAA